MDPNVNVKIFTGGNWEVGGPQGPSTTQGPQGPTFTDNIELSNGLHFELSYTFDPSNPQLLPVNPDANPNVPQPQPSKQYQAATAYYQSFSDNLDQLAEKYNLGDSQVTQLVRQHMLGIPSDDPDVTAALTELEAMVAEEIAQEFDFPSISDLTKRVKNTYKKLSALGVREQFNEAIKKMNLTDSQKAKLKFALENPDYMDPEIKDSFHAAMGQVSEEMDIPKEHLSGLIDNSEFNAMLTVEKDSHFEQLVDNYDVSSLAKERGITEQQVKAQMKNLYYHPDASHPLSDVVNKLETEAFGKISGEFGVPGGFPMEKGTFAFDAVPQGMFLQQFDYNLSNMGLSSEQIANVRAALADPLNPEISANTKALIQEIYDKSVGQIRDLYQLQADWAPPMSLLNELGTITPSTRRTYNAIAFMEEGIKLAGNYLPGGAQRAELVNLLKVVQEALTQLKEQLARIQIMDSQIATMISEAQRDASLYKIDQQMKKLDEVAKKKAEMKPFQDFMKIFSPISGVGGGIAIMILGGPVGWFLGAAMISEATGGENFIKTMFEDLDKSIEDPNLRLFAKYAIVAAMATGGGFFCGMEIIFNQSGIVEDVLVDVFGMDETAAMIVSAVLQVAIDLFVGILLTVALGPVGIGFLSAKILGTVASTTAKVLNTAIKILDALVKVLEKASGKVAKALEKMLKALIKILEKTVAKLNNWVGKVAAKADQVMNLSKIKKGLKKGSDGRKQISKLLKKELWGNKKKKVEAKNIKKILDNLKPKDNAKAIAQLQKQLLQAKDSAKGLYGYVMEATAMLNVLSGAGEVAQGVAHGINAHIHFVQADLATFKAEIDAEVAELETFIKILQNLLKKLMGGMKSMGEWSVEVNEQLSQIMDSQSETMTQLGSA